jgi:signal transduction histidine kinase
MEPMEERVEKFGVGRVQVQALVEKLATVGGRGESVAEVAHDARNMVTALGLYCDLLEEPGVLADPFRHYGNELRLVATASRRLVDKLAALDGGRKARPESGRHSHNSGAVAERRIAGSDLGTPALPAAKVPCNGLPGQGWLENRRREVSSRWDLMPAMPIENMAAELLANHNLLAALAGPSIALTVDVERGARPVRLTGEDLTRVLVNLVKNAAEAMPMGGHIQVGLSELPAAAGTGESVLLTIEDDGPGIPEDALEEVFASGYTTGTKGKQVRGSWPVIHRGLGLSITRSIVEAAGGRIAATNRVQGGAHFAIELPVR